MMGVIVRQKVKGKGQPWWVFISHNGQRASKKVGDKKATEEVASKIRAKIKSGEFGFEEKARNSIPLFKDFAEKFMRTYSALNHKPSTQRSYRQALDQHFYPLFGDKQLNEITRKDVKEFIALKHEEGLSSATIRNLKAYLSCILSDAVDDEIISTHPALRTGKLIPKNDLTKDVNPLSWEEKAKLEKAVKDHYPRWYPFFLTALRTGMRLGELIALQPGDLDFNGNFIEVRRSYTKGHLTTPKSDKIRRVDMSKDLGETLKVYLMERKKETLKRGWKEPPEWLFYNTEGKMIDSDGFRRRVFLKVLEKAELRHIRIHDLRHTYASLRIMKGDNIVDVSKQLGHGSVKLTLDTYTHSIPGTKRGEVDELDSQTEPGRNGVDAGDG